MRPSQTRQPLDLAGYPVPRGRVFVISERCKGCNFCIELCPKDVLVESDAMNAKGYHYPVVALGMEDECANCEFCTLVCPELAIYTVERVEAYA